MSLPISELRSELRSDLDIFDLKTSETLADLASKKPQTTFKQLQGFFKNKFTLTKEQFKKKSYRNILETLFEITAMEDCFEFSAKHLLSFASREVSIGIYHGNYKAMHFFTDLFLNSGTKTKIKLNKREAILRQLFLNAEKEKSYSDLFVLINALGKAANIYDCGDEAFVEDEYFENYINYAVDTLLYYADQNDEDGLYLTSQKLLHQLLQMTMTDCCYGAAHLPFRIIKHYVNSKVEWGEDPLFHILQIEEEIKSLKKEKPVDKVTLNKLEIRLMQFEKLVCSREFLASDFTLYRGAKHAHKTCEIGLDSNTSSKLSLHERQSLAERLIFSKTSYLQNISRSWPKTTYLVANFGMIISDIPHEKGGKHKRIFLTMPIKIEDITITGKAVNISSHAEEAFYDHFLKDENIKKLLENFSKKFKILSSAHKIYGIIFDFHGTYDMCLSCNKKGEAFQNQFRQKLLQLMPKCFKPLTNHANETPIIIRYSSDKYYHYSDSNDNKKKGVPSITEKMPDDKIESKISSEEQKIKYEQGKDIQLYQKSLIFHGDNTWHSLWDYKKEKFFKKALPLDSWTAFTTDNQYSYLTKEQKSLKYTLENGMVNTDVELPDISKLTI